MPIAEERAYEAVKSFLDRQNLNYEERQEQFCDRLSVRNGCQVAHVSVYNSGKITIGGKDGALKALLTEMKAAIETGQALPGQILPFEIDQFPEAIQIQVPDCDPVIVHFVEEAIRCVRADAILAAAFMLGAASERAINTLIYTYTSSITDEKTESAFYLGSITR